VNIAAEIISLGGFHYANSLGDSPEGLEMPTAITFHFRERKKPTMTIRRNDNVVEHGAEFDERDRHVVCLEKTSDNPSRAQIDGVEMIANYAVSLDPHCVLTFNPQTSP
jgi:hypothetical protein